MVGGNKGEKEQAKVIGDDNRRRKWKRMEEGGRAE